MAWTVVFAQPPASSAGAIQGQVNLAAAAKPATAVHAMALTDGAKYQHGATMGAMTMPVDFPLPVAVVYAEPRDDATKAALAKLPPDAAGNASKAELTQKNFTFIPALLPVRVGTTVTFPNEDDTYHNVFSYSSTKPFDLGRYRKEETNPPRVTFDTAGVVKVYCEIHEFMRATILVLDTPYFTVTDSKGNYRLEGLAPGAYQLTAWVNDKSVWSRPVEVRAGEQVTADLAPESPAKPAP